MAVETESITLTREVGQRIVVDGNIEIELRELRGKRARIMITTLKGVLVLRAELLEGGPQDVEVEP